MTKEMTHGSPTKLILSFMLPLFFGNIFQNLYSMVDAAIVGRVLGTDALAAVGSTGSVMFLLVGFSLGICSGFAIPIAQCFGAHDYKELRRYLGNSIVLIAIFAVVFSVLTVALSRTILILMDTPTDILDAAHSYLVIIFAGIPATLLYNMVSGIQRALGDSRTPVIFLVIASVINVLLDIVFVVFSPMGVAGAALATIISQLVSGLGCLIHTARRYEMLHLSREDFRLSKTHVLHLINMGLPMALQTSITAVGSVILQTSVNALGTVAVASITAANKVYMFFDSVTGALGVTMSNYSGQNIGAKQYDRVNRGIRSCVVIGCIYAVLALIIIAVFGKILLLIFMDSNETEILTMAYQYLLINGAFLIPLMLVNSIRPTIQGMGFSRLAMFAGVFELAARSIAGLILVPAFGFTAACFAGPLAWLMADCFLIPAYRYTIRTVRRNGENQP